jgi:GntR family carbon starvation induced transcriptional regulator
MRRGEIVFLSSAPSRRHNALLPDDVVQRLREDILSGTLQPEQRLKFEELRIRYEASVATLREALLNLVSEGLVQSEQNRGFAVAPVSIADFRDITELRVEFEKQSIADSIAHGDDVWEGEIVTSLHLLLKLTEGAGTRSPEWPARHRRFHQALVARCQSPWLLHFRSVLFDHAERYRSLGRRYRKAPRNVSAEHKALADAALDRDVSKAILLAEKHIRSTADNVIANVPGLNKLKQRTDNGSRN